MKTATSAFSLIELLVVVAIIGILAGLLTPAVKKMIDDSGRAKAAAQAVSIANAIKSYRSTYSQWPGQDDSTLNTDSAITQDKIINGLRNNPRGINFLEIKSGQIAPNGFLLDPWRRYFEIAVDVDGDGSVASGSWTADGPSGTLGITATTNVAKQTVLVMSWGPKPDKPDKWVRSWLR